VGSVPPSPRRYGRPIAILVGDFLYPPNRAGLAFLTDHVLPRVWRRVPELELHVVGRALAAPADLDARVVVMGFVEDLDAVYDQAGLAVVPLLKGGGSPLKFVEALARALPVVATPVAAAGLDVRPGRDCFVADGADAFASAMIDALDPDRARNVALAGRRLAEREYSIEALVRRLAA